MTSEQPLAQSVAMILATQLEIALEEVVPRACLFVDLRALPLALVRASLALEEAFGVVIPDESLADVRTVGDFIALAARHSSPSAARAVSAWNSSRSSMGSRLP